MAPHEFVEIRLVCKADYLDPQLKIKLHEIKDKLREILHTGRRRFALKKVQPWNSVKVTFDIPKEAADRLRLLAVQGNVRLIELGILSVEIVGQSNAIVVTKNSPSTTTTTTTTNSTTTNSINKELPTKTSEDKSDDQQHRTKRMKVENESDPPVSSPIKDRSTTVSQSNNSFVSPNFPRISHSHPTFVSPSQPTASSSSSSSSSSYPSAAALTSNGIVHEMSANYHPHYHQDSWTNYSDSTANNYKMKVNGVVTRTSNHYYHPAQQQALLLTENTSQSATNASMFCPTTTSTNNPYEMRNTPMPNSYDGSSTS